MSLDAYTQEISRATPASFLFLLDQSTSMEDPFGGEGGQAKMDAVANMVNNWIDSMVTEATKDEGVRDYLYIGVLGYRTDMNGNPIVGSVLSSDLQGDHLVPISEFEEKGFEMVSLERKHFNPETGDVDTVTVERPQWVSPVADGGTPMCTVLYEAYYLLEKWLQDGNHMDCFPPIVIHVTDGECTEEGDPNEYADSLKGLASNNGNVLLFNCHISEAEVDGIFCPQDKELLPNEYAKLLYDMASVIPEPLVEQAHEAGIEEVSSDSRGMVFNADSQKMIKFLQIGTRVAKNLR